MRHVRQAHESWLDHIGKGVWFAVGFTPIFILVVVIAVFIFLRFFTDGIDRAYLNYRLSLFYTSPYAPGAGYVIPPEDLNVIPKGARVVSPPPVAEIHETSMTDKKAIERECSLLLLKYQQTQDESIKQKMYDICP